ncbi:cytosine permease, partial [Pseudomonas aeruginosa]|uniref:cytosine permease n=1 Tax=Pseudomonas aeruginosa TaxID=287 RepID=UPI0031B7727B
IWGPARTGDIHRQIQTNFSLDDRTATAAALGMADISDVMIAQGLLLPAIVVLGLNIWTTNDNALYASGLGFANITGMSSKTLSVINGIIGTVCALWLYN